jgi:hypothetical protein
MYEVCIVYDLLPGVNKETYAAWAKKAIAATLKQPGLIEFRAHRNVLGSPEVRTTSVWNSGAEWIAFAEGGWKLLEEELRVLAKDLRMEVWGPSPLVPQPLRPGK